MTCWRGVLGAKGGQSACLIIPLQPKQLESNRSKGNPLIAGKQERDHEDYCYDGYFPLAANNHCYM